MRAGVFVEFASIIGMSLIAIGSAHAAPGDPDPTWAETGIKRTGFAGGHDRADAVAVQADGKVIIGGFSQAQYPYSPPRFTLVRLGTNNLPDPLFGDGGTVVTPVGREDLDFTSAGVNAVRIQQDGKIVAAGFSTVNTNYYAFTLARYNQDGSLDPNFGTNGTGIVYTDLGEGAKIRAMVIQSDGRIVVAGHTQYPSNAGEGAVALARYEADGTLDGSFGNGGIQITTGIAGYTGAHALALQSDGKIVASGIGIGSGHGGIDFALYRYTSDGNLDSTFGGGSGKVFTQISTNNSGYFDSANAIAIQFGNNTPQSPDEIVVAGSYRGGSPANYTVVALARYNLDGSLDTTFGNSGIVTNAFTTGSAVFSTSYGTSLLVQGVLTQPRRIVVGGYGKANGVDYFILARYNANGSFDTSFGTNGTGISAIPLLPGPSPDIRANGMALQSGKFVLVGHVGVFQGNYDFAAARFNADGSPDTSFSNDGILRIDVADLESSAKGVAIQPDGKVVVVGLAKIGEYTAMAAARFLPNGSLDSSFGVAGKATFSPGAGSAEASAVLMQPDGKIVLAGFAFTGARRDFAVVRINSDGTLDTSFGTAGLALTAFGSSDASATSLALQPDGKLVVAGTSTSAGNADFAVARYTATGLLDNSFDGDGKLTTAIALGNDNATSVKLQADGKIVVAGYADLNGNTDFVLVRYQANGALDNTFGSFGRVATDIGTATGDFAMGMVIQEDGKMVVAGYSGNLVTGDFALARYTSNGVLDTSFDGDGKVTTPIGLGIEYATSVALQSDGKIVAAGLCNIGAFLEFAAVRYHSNGALDDSYGIGGKTLVNFGDNDDNFAYSLAIDGSGRAVIVGDAAGLFGIARLQGDPLLRIHSIDYLGNATYRLKGEGIPGGTHRLIAFPALNGGTAVSLGPITADAAGLWQYDDGPLNGVSSRFYRLSLP